ncbi:hypothetical protein Tco_1171065, partial [Tanacetum coccineum]
MVSTTNTSLVVSADEVFDEMTMNKFLKRECTVDEYYAYYTSTVSNKDWSERYTIGLFVFGLQSEIGKRVEMFNPKSLSDAYYLALLQERTNNLMKGKTKASFFHTSCVKDSREVMDEVDGKKFVENGFKLNKIDESQVSVHCRNDSIMDFDKVCEEDEVKSSGVVINNFGLKVLDITCEEKVEGIGMKSKGSVELDGKNMEMDGKCLEDIDKSVNKDDKIEENRNKIGIKSRELAELDDKNMEAFLNDVKIDSKGWVDCDSSCDESELESIVSCKVDVDGVVNCEEDGKDNKVKSSEVITNNFRLKENRKLCGVDMKVDVSRNGAESVVMDVGEFLNGEDENLVCKSNVGSLVVGHDSNIFEVDKKSGTISVYDSSVHDFSKRVLTCDDMFYKKWNLKDLSEVIDTTKDSKILVELSKEEDKDNHSLVGNFIVDSGAEKNGGVT